MACFKPLTAFQTESGEVVFNEVGNIRRELSLPCGQCIGCRLERSRQWAVRCMHEAQMHEYSCFITLTYDDESVPVDGSLRYSDYQQFMKRLRARATRARQRRLRGNTVKELRHESDIGRNDERCLFSEREIRFYMAGEYGETTGRPHFHAILFGVFFADRTPIGRSPAGDDLFTSATLADVWNRGHVSLGDANFKTAAYVARYCCSKVTGELADEHYKRVSSDGEVYWIQPEFNHMSLKPGIGVPWFKKFWRDVYPSDTVIVNGRECKPPKSYDRLLRETDGFLADDVEYRRYKESMRHAVDNTRQRLAAREECAKARNSFKRRGL